MKLQGKVALITGGTTGIGLETAALFHAEGARVFVTGRNIDNIAQAKKRLPTDVTVLAADTADLSDIDVLVRRIKEEAGRVDVLFVNAGIARFVPIEGVTPALFDEQFNVNFRGAYFTDPAAAAPDACGQFGGADHVHRRGSRRADDQRLFGDKGRPVLACSHAVQ